MEAWIESLVHGLPLWGLFAILVGALLAIGKGADMVVDEAVTLSLRWGVPTVVIGATLVSLGTTTPEAAVSVSAAVSGNPSLALGNAVGSIIVDCGLILGLACVLSPLPLDRAVVNRQGWLQIGAGFLLVLCCVPWSSPVSAFTTGGSLPQAAGWLFVVLLGVYLYLSLRWAKKDQQAAKESAENVAEHADTSESVVTALLKLFLGLAVVVLASKVLIPTVEETALRLSIPDSIIAATLVAFGTSLPELVTALTAVRKGHGELAVGNVIGADILNVLFVAGLSASVTPAGLAADPHFFTRLFPGMLLLLIVFRVGVWASDTHLRRPFGFLMIAIYLAITLSSYLA